MEDSNRFDSSRFDFKRFDSNCFDASIRMRPTGLLRVSILASLFAGPGTVRLSAADGWSGALWRRSPGIGLQSGGRAAI